MFLEDWNIFVGRFEHWWGIATHLLYNQRGPNDIDLNFNILRTSYRSSCSTISHVRISKRVYANRPYTNKGNTPEQEKELNDGIKPVRKQVRKVEK